MNTFLVKWLLFRFKLGLLFFAGLVAAGHAAPGVQPFAPIAIDNVEVYSVDPAKRILRVIRTSTAASSELGQFDSYPIFVFELIKIPQQQVLQQFRIQKSIQLIDGGSFQIKSDELMDVIPERHEFNGETLRVWINYYPPRPPGLLVECSYKISSNDIQVKGCSAKEM